MLQWVTTVSQTKKRRVTANQVADCADHHQSQRAKSMSGGGYPKFKNDRGVPEICIGVNRRELITQN
jgi:hypothetical protein